MMVHDGRKQQQYNNLYVNTKCKVYMNTNIIRINESHTPMHKLIL
jgi:hypothetical protein